MHFSPSFGIKHLWKARVAGTQCSQLSRSRRPGRRRLPRRLSRGPRRPRLPPPATGAGAATSRRRGCRRAPLGPRVVRSTIPPPQPTWPRGHHHPVLHWHTHALPLARDPALRGDCRIFLPLSGQEGCSVPHPSSACSNRTRGCQGCAHLTSGAGVAAHRSAPSWAQRAARPELRRPEHPALPIPNGLFQQPGAETDLLPAPAHESCL